MVWNRKKKNSWTNARPTLLNFFQDVVIHVWKSIWLDLLTAVVRVTTGRSSVGTDLFAPWSQIWSLSAVDDVRIARFRRHRRPDFRQECVRRTSGIGPPRPPRSGIFFDVFNQDERAHQVERRLFSDHFCRCFQTEYGLCGRSHCSYWAER